MWMEDVFFFVGHFSCGRSVWVEWARRADVAGVVALAKAVWDHLPGPRQVLEERVARLDQALQMICFRSE